MSSFYVTGGTLRRDAPCYVPRQADIDLLAGLSEGKFCYVLTSRQMGKSSLMVRTAVRLREEGVAVAVLDLTALGQNLTTEQWYDGLLTRVGQQLDLEDELEEFWLDHERLGPLQRWMRAIREVVLEKIRRQVVIFIDEIDAVRSLPFSTDEFFAALREFFNRRTEDPELTRLTFCLLGVATPSDLIRDTRTTPFNIGRRIELTDFTEAEAAALVRGLGRDEQLGLTLLNRILHWTNGHPYLTQRFCQAVAENQQIQDAPAIDRFCEELFLSSRAREHDDNLLFVRERILRSETDLGGLLDFYARICSRQAVRDDDTNPLINILRLAGIVHIRDGLIVVRNRIYAHVFDQEWVTSHMPDAEIRRQRVAYRRGMIRTTLIAVVILAIMAALLVAAIKQRDRAEQQELSKRRLLYAAQMNLAQQAWEDANVAQVLELLEAYHPKPGQEDFRGFEWYYLWRLCHTNLMTLHHKSLVYAVAFSPDGKWIATGNADSTVKLWNATNGQEVATLTGHVGWVYSVAFSPDNQTLATAGEDGIVRLWDIRSQKLVHSLTRHTDDVNSAVFSPDGKLLATGSDDKTVKLWNTDTWQELVTLTGHLEGINPVAFSPDGKTLATGSKDTTVKLWDVQTHQELASLRGHTDWVRSLAFSPDGKLLATASMDSTVKLWNIEKREEFATLKGHTSLVHSVVFSPDGTRVATGSWDNTAKIWNVETQQAISTLKEHLDRVWAVAFSPDGKRLATGSEDHTVKLWDVDTEQDWTTLKKEPGRVTSLAFSGDGKILAAGTGYQFPTGRQIVTEEPGTVFLWDVLSRREIAALHGFTHPVWAVAISPDNRFLATATGDGHRFITQSKPQRASDINTLKVWDLATLQEVPLFKDHRIPVWAVAFSPDGQMLAVGGGGNVVIVYDVDTGQRLFELKGHTNDINSIAFSPDGKRLATGSDDQTIRLWDMLRGSELALLDGHTGPVVSVAFSRDNQLLVSGSRDRTVRVWDLATRRETLTLRGHRTNISSVLFSPDGNRIVTGSQDGTTKLWDLQTGQQLATLKGHSSWVNAVVFSPDGKILATGSQDSTVKLWQTE
ncbi:MAG TPA: AAA-like domain-containing protein [Acidobacteriota bacterium]|nr:AAA-like domain-containing protein [Acidobacteriota bacterium]